MPAGLNPAPAYRFQPIPAALLIKSVDQRGHDEGTASVQRVADCSVMGTSPKGLAKSRAGTVLVIPISLKRIAAEGIADKGLSELLARELLVPVVHGTAYEALCEVSPYRPREAA